MSSPTKPVQCPCNSGLLYRQCCRPLHRGEMKANTAEQLMRSRYSAYARRLIPYIHQSWAEQTRPELKSLQSYQSPELQWLSLDILAVEAGQPGDQAGVVEFNAAYTENGVKSVLYERSYFKFQQDTWFYLKAA